MWTTIILFLVILFTYIHIQSQHKTGEDLEVFEYSFSTPKDLQDITSYKQPILFPMTIPFFQGDSSLDSLFIKDVRDNNNNNTHVVADAISLSNRSAKGLLETDTQSVFYSEGNHASIINHSNWRKWFRALEIYLKPYFTISSEYDVMYGSFKTRTPTTFNRESHVYLYLPIETNHTHIRIKMTPWKNRQYLETFSDYTCYKFGSKKSLYEKNDDQYKCLDFFVFPGSVLFIPPFWFYSIEFQSTQSEVCMVKYTTGPNFLANINHMGLYFAQQQNIQEKWWKTTTPKDETTAVKHTTAAKYTTAITKTMIESEIETNGGDEETKEKKDKSVAETLIDELQPKN